MSNVTNAIDGIYTANPNQQDRDLAFLVLKLGGPSLLSTLHSAGILPSVSLAYKMSKNCEPISTSLKLSACFRKNVSLSDVGKCLTSLKMDETFVNL